MGGGIPTTNETLLDFQVIPEVDGIVEGIVNTINVLFRIKTEKDEEVTTRPPIDLAIVLDRSGSMRGDKINKCKKAIIQCIDNLSLDDTFHFVAYDSTATVIVENGNMNDKDSLRRKVSDVRHQGTTNMSDGILTGKKLLQKHRVEGHTQRMFLFSDGLANCGVTSHSALLELIGKCYDDGITTCSFGIGADFDEELMTGIAEYGNANYFYIEDASEIEKYVGGALDGLLGVIGRNAVLKIRGSQGSLVEQIYGYDNITQGISINDIRQSNLKNILAKVKVTPSDKGPSQEILSYELSYDSVKEEKEVSLKGVLSLDVSSDDSAFEKNADVEIAVAIQVVANLDDDAMKHMDNDDDVSATKAVEEQIERLRSVSSKDKSGRVERLMEKTSVLMDDIKSKKGGSKNKVMMKKKMKYHQQLKRKDSADYLMM